MEEQGLRSVAAGDDPEHATPVAWRDLREWLSLVDANGLLKRIEAPVDPDEELAAIEQGALRARGRPRPQPVGRRDDRGKPRHHAAADCAAPRAEDIGARQ